MAEAYNPDYQCAGKRTFATKPEAKRYLARVRSWAGGDKMNAYRCPWCQMVHIGHAPRKGGYDQNG